ncbi:MAG: alpha-glucosidase C-terminal domain-containing protein, partial [Christiangramia sp.]
GTVKERMGDASEAMLAMSYTIPGMPLIYSGQEYDMDKRLRFFEKDTIPHQKGKVYPILEKLGKLKNENAALHGAKQAASYETLETSNQEKILAYERKGGGSELIYLANMSDQPVKFTVSIAGDYQDYMANSELQIEEGQEMEFQPWEYKILTKN